MANGFEPIWAVPRSVRDAYVVMFVATWLLLAWSFLWSSKSLADYISVIGSATIASAGFALVLAESFYAIGVSAMVLGTRIKRHFEGRQRRHDEQIRRDAVDEWVKWNNRRESALQRGELFDEPPPSEGNGVEPQ